ncbi:MAG TPA: M14 family zinc carboxypeptidase [Vicinamibacterales bacterium]|nr:M14 family zinc carboxypeptidase [Vicinamibacterales bacterium]
MTSPGGRSRRMAVLALLLAATAMAGAQQGPRQQQDEEFAKAVREWTTKPEFLSPLVDHLPVVAGVPSPRDVLGHHVGEPKRLTYYADALKYYRALAAATPRVKVMPIGTSDEGRELVVVVVASEESLRNLESNRQDLARLADPRGLSEADAAAIVARAKPIYHVMGGLHSAETGPPEMLMELAYRLAVEDSPILNQVRDNVIVTITPAADPDGRDRYVDWYYAHKTDEVDEDDSNGGPPYWGKYVFHDNNRDINYSQVSMQAVLKWYLEWHPPILHDIHESVPFLYTFSGQAPQNPTLDPILYGELPWFANFEMAQMIKYGMPGVWTHAFVDMWSPGYFGSMASNHNGMLRMYEVFGNGGANTMKRTVAPRDAAQGGGRTTREWYRPLPPYKEVEWSIRNNVNYGQTAILSALQLTAAFPREVLDNFYRKSRNAVRDGSAQPPYAYLIPAGQRDMTRVAFLVNNLRLQGIEVGRARGEVKLEDGTFPAGSLLVKRDQPYGRLAKILLEKQDFPDANLRTYDDSGWTMGLHTATEVKAIADKAVLEVPVEAVSTFEVRGSVAGARNPAAWAVAANGSSNLVTLRHLLRDLKVEAARAAFKEGDRELPAGSFIVSLASAPSDASSRVRGAVESLGLEAVGLAKLPDVARHDVDLPRLAMFSTWGSTQEVGWVRHAFDRFRVPYDLIFNERVRKGGLRRAYDVILVPSQSGSGKRLVFDIEPKKKPLAYRKTDRFQFLGAYGESDDITGGMGLEGVLELQRFVDEGGVLITLGAASYFPAEFGLARRLEASRPSAQFYAPGPLVEAEILKRDHPIFYGYPSKTVPVRYANGPLLRLPEPDKGQALMQFRGGDGGVLSGLMKGAAEVRNRPAVVDIPSGNGRVIVFATNPCYNWQNLGEFNMLFNALLFYNDR